MAASVLPLSSFIAVIISVYIECATDSVTRALVDHRSVLKTLARSDSVTIVPHDGVVVPPSGCIDVDVEGICRIHMRLKVGRFKVLQFAVVDKFGDSFVLVWSICKANTSKVLLQYESIIANHVFHMNSLIKCRHPS